MYFSISPIAKLRYCNSVVLPDYVFAAETIVINEVSKFHVLENQERNILLKSAGLFLKMGFGSNFR